MNTFTERPIIFSGDSVRAIRAGRKTQSRRVVKNAKPYAPTDSDIDVLWATGQIRCPFGQPGDHLWVREAWQKARPDIRMDGTSPVAYMATDAHPATGYGPFGHEWKSPLFMPRWASRITLEITGVRVERVQNISDADAIAEGIDAVYIALADMTHGATSPIEEFRALWNGINARRGFGWDINPWVWVIEFEVLA